MGREKIDGGSVVEIRNVIEIAVTHLGRRVKRVAHLLPSDFADLRHALGFKWNKVGEGEAARWVRTDKSIAAATLKRRIIHVRAMFRWAGPDGEKLIPAPSYGDEFALVSDATVASRKRSASGSTARSGSRSIRSCRSSTRWTNSCRRCSCCRLNCGFTAVDCASLPWSAVDMAGGWIDFARVKTGVERPRVKLWPETVEALQHVRKLKLSPAPGWADIVVHQDKDDQGQKIGDPIRSRNACSSRRAGGPGSSAR
jgi:integrase